MRKSKREKRILGFTLVELLVVILITSIFLMAVLGVYLMGNKYLKESKPVSDVIEEARSGLATLEFLFSRRGVGVPPENDTLTCNSGDFSTGCKDLEFYANIKGFGFVVNNATGIDLVSCRLSSKDDENYYYVFRDGKLVNGPIYKFCENFREGPDCVDISGDTLVNLTLNNSTMSTNCTDANNTITLQPGDIIMRVPYKVRVYVSNPEGYWLMMQLTDLATGNSSATRIARVKDQDSFNATCLDSNCTALKVRITFQSQSKPEKTFTIERVFSREVR